MGGPGEDNQEDRRGLKTENSRSNHVIMVIFSLQGPGAVVETGKKGKAGAKKGGKVEE